MSGPIGVSMKSESWLVRGFLISAGTASLALGLVGILVPILPTTPFLLLAAACYARSSPRFYNWMIGNRLFGAYLRSYREGRGLPLRIKAFTICTLWMTILTTVLLLLDQTWPRVLLLLIASMVTIHILTIKTCDVG